MCEDCEEQEKKTYAPSVEQVAGELADAHTYIRTLRKEKQELGQELGAHISSKQRRDVWVGIAVLLLLSAYLILIWEVL